MTGPMGTDALDERTSFLNFVVAFEGLLGDDVAADDPLRVEQIEALADFALALVLPPNPVRRLDNRLTASQARGRALFVGPRRMVGRSEAFDLPDQPAGFTCEGCHALDPAAGFYGTDGAASAEFLSQVFKLPQLRSLYTRVGMFGMPNVPHLLRSQNRHQGDQIRGFGFMNDGTTDTVARLLRNRSFVVSDTIGFQSDAERRDMEQFLLAFDADLAPIVGQQVSVGPTSGSAARDRAGLLIARAGTPFTSLVLGGTVTECDLVVRYASGGRQVGRLLEPATGRFLPDASDLPSLDEAGMLALVDQGTTLTFTCVPPGSGVRSALDRDRDGALDGDEVAAGTDPADPADRP
jgi:hypothetical protein